MTQKNTLNEIEKLALKVSSLISTTKASCTVKDYICEEITLDCALENQKKLLEKVIELNYSN